MLRGLLVAALLMTTFAGVPGAASTGCDQVETGQATIGLQDAGINERFYFPIDAACQGEAFTLHDTSGTPGPLPDWDICFTGSGGSECSQAFGDEAGRIPVDATYAEVTLYLGVDASFEFRATTTDTGDPTVTVRQDFLSGHYYQRDWFEWTTTEIDVIINLAPTQDPLGRAAALQESIDRWREGIDHFGAQWLREGVVIRDYVVGHDVIPDAVLDDPEVVIGSMEPGVLGVAVHPGHVDCAVVADDGQSHQHDDSDWEVGQAVDCVSGEPLHFCLIANTNWRLNNIGMQDLNAHEFGHCLGLGHAGDPAADFAAKDFSRLDIMNYRDRAGHVQCVSEPNIRGIELAFASALDQATPSYTQVETMRSSRFIERAASEYEQVDCDNAPPGFLG